MNGVLHCAIEKAISFRRLFSTIDAKLFSQNQNLKITLNEDVSGAHRKKNTLLQPVPTRDFMKALTIDP